MEQPGLASTGITYVIVNGTLVVQDSIVLDEGALVRRYVTLLEKRGVEIMLILHN